MFIVFKEISLFSEAAVVVVLIAASPTAHESSAALSVSRQGMGSGRWSKGWDGVEHAMSSVSIEVFCRF